MFSLLSFAKGKIHRLVTPAHTLRINYKEIGKYNVLMDGIETFLFASYFLSSAQQYYIVFCFSIFSFRTQIMHTFTFAFFYFCVSLSTISTKKREKTQYFAATNSSLPYGKQK